MHLRQAATTTTSAAATAWRRQRQRQQAPPAARTKRPVVAARAAPNRRIIAVAVDQSRASRRAVSWAVENLWREENDAELRLFHVVPAVSSTSAFALGGLAAGVASAPLDSAASLDGGDGGEFASAADLAAAEAMAAAGFVSVATTTTTRAAAETTTTSGHHSTDEQRALARRAGRALSATLLPLAQRRGCSRATVAVIQGRPGASVAEDLCRAAEASGAAMLVLASSRRPGGGGYDDEGASRSGGSGGGGWFGLGEVLGSVLFKPPVSSEVARRCKVPTVLLGPE
jgi:nucleotide-binding universal stress UspA family protein